MENTIVPATHMLKKKDFRPLNRWHRLNTNSWIFDFGLIRKWNDETGHGDYFVTDKGNKEGWDFLLYAGEEDVKIFLEHYQLPADTQEFLKWVWNWVAAGDDWKGDNTITRGQMNFFPYKLLYDGWKKAMTEVETQTAATT